MYPDININVPFFRRAGIGGPLTQYTPQDTFNTGVLGVWLAAYAGDSADLKVNTDGTGGAVAEGGTIGRWTDKSGATNHAINTTANLRPVWMEGSVHHFHATQTTARSSFLMNASMPAIPRANCSGGFLVNIFDQTGPLPILDLGGSDLVFMAGSNTIATNRFLSYFDAVAFRTGSNIYRGRKCIVTWRSNGSNLIINVDGQETSYTALSAVDMTKYRLASFNGGLPAPHQGNEFVIFNSDVGAIEIGKLRDYLNNKAENNLLNTAKTVVTIGDSLLGAVGSEYGKPVMDYVTNRSDSVWYQFNKEGGFAQTVNQHLTAAQALALKGSTEGVYIIRLGTNDILGAGRTGAQLEADIAALCTAIRAGGGKVVLFNLHQFNGTAPQIVERDAANVLFGLNAAGYTDKFIDISDLSGNTTDGVHQLDSDIAIMGGRLQTNMAALA